MLYCIIQILLQCGSIFFPQQLGVLGAVVYSLVPLTNFPEEAGVTLSKGTPPTIVNNQ